MRFDENPFEKEDKKKKCEKEDKNPISGFEISHFYASFSNDMIAVKGLRSVTFQAFCRISSVVFVYRPSLSIWLEYSF